MNPEYIVVQAGGKGTRLGRFTQNKPKALVPVNNLPMLFHLFRAYPKSRYLIIGDYKFDVLARYLAAFSSVDYQLICASGHTGTCAGLKEAVSKVPGGQPFLLIWSDLILPDGFTLPEQPGNYIGVAKDFPCRWQYRDGHFKEEASETFGVAGVFAFESPETLADVPEEGEFVRWMSGTGLAFQSMPLYQVKEFGLLSEYERLESARCRPFNRTYREGALFVKEPIDAQGEALAQREIAWYQEIQRVHFANIPKIVSYQPLKMEYIDGKSIYEYSGLSQAEKIELLEQMVDCLRSLHTLKVTAADRASYHEAYIGKTLRRLEKVRELVPFAKDRYVTVNGKRCRNVFFCLEALERQIEQFMPERFELLHGDCTFSNIMLRSDKTPVLIDPRGYFGCTRLCGDPAYDWAKLYYSIVGNYDQFNRKRFSLTIGTESVTLQIASNGWEGLEPVFFSLLKGEVTPRQIRLLHAIIWLSLTTYTWEDYDSICGAFYNGLYYLEEALREDIF